MRKPVRVLALARMELSANRGTPIRVRSILTRLASDQYFELTLATWDQEAPLPTRWFHLDNSVSDIWRVISFVRAARVELVIGHTLSSWFLLLAVRICTCTKVMLEMHGFPEEEAKLYDGIPWYRFWFDRFAYECTFRACDLITACSETAAEHIRAFNPHTITVYGGADMDVFNPSVAPESRSDTSRVRIGYVGNGRLWQGVPFLFETYQQYLAQDTAFELAILLSEQKGLAIPPGVNVHPAVSHELAPRFLASCDILVIPRPQNEVNRLSFPSKLIEYMAMGKPVIASRTSDVHKIITHGVDGMLFRPGDSEGFVRTILELKNPDLRKRIGQAAYETVKRSYTWENQTDIIKKAIYSLFTT